MSNPSTPRLQFFDTNGDPLAGGVLYSYEAGTLIALACYSDAALTTPVANPQTLDADGRLPRYYMADQLYKFILKDSSYQVVWTEDNVPGNRSDQDATPDRLAQAISDPITQGAVGDGVADESSYVQAAIDAATGTVDLLGKTYRCDSALTLKSGLRLKGSGGHLDFSNCTDSELIVLEGSLGDSKAFSVDASEGDTSITLADTSGIVEGTWLYLSSSAAWSSGNPIGEVVQMTGAASVRSALQSDYNTGDAAYAKIITPASRIVVEDLKVTCGSNTTGINTCFVFDKCTDVRVENVEVTNMTNIGIKLNRCVNVDIDNCHFHDLNASLVSPLYGGICISGACRDITVENCLGTDLSGASSSGVYTINNVVGDNGINSRVYFIDCCARECTKGFYLGQTSRDIIVRGGSIEGKFSGIDYGVQAYGVNVSIDNLLIENVSKYGIYVNHASVTATFGQPWHFNARRNTIRHVDEQGIFFDIEEDSHVVCVEENEVYDTDTGAGHYPIQLTCTGSLQVYNAVIRNNIIQTYANGIFVDVSATSILGDLWIDGNVCQGSTAGFGIKVDDSAGPSRIANTHINNNLVTNSTYPIHLLAVDDVGVIGNEISSCTVGILYDANSTGRAGITIKGNRIWTCGTAFQLDSDTVRTQEIDISDNDFIDCSQYGVRLDYFFGDVNIDNNKIVCTGPNNVMSIGGHSTESADGVRIRNNTILVGSAHGINMNDANNVQISNNSIVGCDSSDDSIRINDCNHTKINHNHVDGRIYINDSDDVSCSFNLFSSCVDNAIEYDNNDAAHSGITISGNQMDNVGGNGIYIQGTTAAITVVNVSGNTIRQISTASDVCLLVEGKVTGMLVNGNLFERYDDLAPCTKFVGDAAASIQALNVSGNIFINGTYGIDLTNEGECIQDGNLFYSQATGDINGGPFDVDGDHHVA